MDLDDPKSWSVSALRTVESCGAQYLRRYLLAPAVSEQAAHLQWGTALHKTIERIHAEKAWEPTEWTRIWTTEWRKASADITNWGPVRYSTYDNLGAKILVAYTNEPVKMIDARTGEIVGHMLNRDAKVLLAEHYFPGRGKVLKVGRYPIKGIVDQIRRLPNGRAIIIDFKSSKDAPDADILRSDPQLTMYWQYGKSQDEDCLVGIYHLRSNTLFLSQRSDADLALLEGMLREGQLKVDNKLFARNVSFSCKYCSHRVDCLGGAGGSDPEIKVA